MSLITFIVNREVFRVKVEQGEIWYSDRKWEKEIRLIPKDEDFLKKIRLSRNKLPASLNSIFNLTKEEELQYIENKHDDKKLTDICIEDAKKKGATLLRVE